MMEAAKRTLDQAPTTGEASTSTQEAITTAKIDSQKLRQEFLRQKEPTLEGLLQIAKNWQRSNDVNKNLEATTEA